MTTNLPRDVFLYLLAMFLEVIALIKLRSILKDRKDNFTIPFGKWGLYIVVGLAILVIFAVVFINLISLSNNLKSLLIIFVSVLVGVFNYYFYSRRKIRE